MKCILLIGLMLIPVITISHAKQTAPFRPIEHEVAFDGCHFKIADPYNGSLTLTTDGAPPLANYHGTINPKAGHPFETWIQFDCYNNITWSDLPNLSGGGLAKVNGKWVIAYKNPKELNMKLYTFHGKNWDGAGTTADQQDGDEDRRTRSFVFCIIHGSQALCGTDNTVMYLAHPDESVLSQEIKLLESIEFIDTPATKQGMPASPSTAP